ncbi:MAG TPA: hypothetical protein VK964_11935 [Nocardioidaceae bacterium]|nr:hypothetical protein [Nocardioidaceae bacterium]
MTAAQEPPVRTEPVVRFRATSGRVVGSVGLAVVAALLGYVAVGMQNTTGLRMATGLVFLGVLVWVTQLRPRATAYPDVLHLQNSLRDATVPLAAVDGVTVRRMLNVWVGDRRYVCIGIGIPLHKMVGFESRGASSLLGWDRLEAYTEEATPPLPDRSAMSYPDFVEARIADLVRDARRRADLRPGATAALPRETWAWPEIVALAGTAVAFVLSLVL